MQNYYSKTVALLVSLSLIAAFGVSPVLAKSAKGNMSKSAIVAGEKSAAQSFGECIAQSNLIVLGEYKTEGKIAVHTVLKGSNSWVGKTITLPEPARMGCRLAPVPSIKYAAVLLQLKTENKKSSQETVVAIYDTPDDLSFLEHLVPVYSNKSEHTRLTSLSDFISKPGSFDRKTFEEDPTPIFKKEFYWAIKQIREPANFDLVKSLYLKPNLAPKDKLVLQEWFAETRDNRAIPILINALQSDDQWLVRGAACSLMWYFPNEKTDAAIAKIANTAPDDMRPSIAKYLKARGVKTIGAAYAVPPQTPYQKAEELRQNGKSKEAAQIFLSILESKETNGYVIRTAAQGALKDADDAVKARILKSRIDWLNHDAATGNYLEATDTAEILRQLHSPQCLDGLMAILPRRDSIFSKANRIATMAIVDLGADARKKASAALLKELEAQGSTANKHDEQSRLLLEFAWIKQQGDYEKAEVLIANKPNWSSAIATVKPLLKGIDATDEGASLVQLLKQRPPLSGIVTDWIVFRLGDLRESRAGDTILELFTSPSYSPQTISDALTRIGGTKLLSKIEAIAVDSKSPYQGPAVEILANCQHENALPILRNILKTGSLEGKVRSLAGISRFGNCADKKVLIPMADYWTGEREIHYWLLQAITEIDNRCHCR